MCVCFWRDMSNDAISLQPKSHSFDSEMPSEYFNRHFDWFSRWLERFCFFYLYFCVHSELVPSRAYCAFQNPLWRNKASKTLVNCLMLSSVYFLKNIWSQSYMRNFEIVYGEHRWSTGLCYSDVLQKLVWKEISRYSHPTQKE